MPAMADRLWYVHSSKLGEFCVRARSKTEAKAILAGFVARAAANAAEVRPCDMGMAMVIGEVIRRDLMVEMFT